MHSCNAGAMNINGREHASNELEYINLAMGITILNMHDIWYSCRFIEYTKVNVLRL